MSQEQQHDAFEEIIKALTEDKENIIKEANEVYNLLKQKIDDLIKKTGRHTTVEPSLEIINPYRITGKVIIESEKYDEYVLKSKYTSKIKDFDLVITISKYYSSVGKNVLELSIIAYKLMNENTGEEN